MFNGGGDSIEYGDGCVGGCVATFVATTLPSVAAKEGVDDA